jgi:predicted nucleic acid-binding protein
VILPDTSVWVEYLRSSPPPRSESEGASLAGELDALIEQEQVLTCGPVAAELLAGARGDHRDQLAKQLGAQPWIDLKRADWLTVGHTAAKLQERGLTTPLIDVQIAVCAVKAKAELWTLDHDFARVAEALDGLRIRLPVTNRR